jgi:aminoglycoside phosphotransferase (APT) family kinase protein
MPSTQLTAVIESLLPELRERAPGMYPELEGERMDVRLVSLRQRVFATIAKVRISSSTEHRDCLVKMTHTADELPPELSPDRIASHPLAPFLPSADPPGWEYRALLAIQSHFDESPRPELSSVRVRGSLGGDRALVMDYIPGRHLGCALRRSARRARPTVEIHRWMAIAGAWLREFHSIDPLSHTLSAPLEPAEAFRQDLNILFEYLGHHAGRPAGGLSGLRELASDLDASTLNTGVCHHDFAPRNVLLREANSVAVVDTLMGARRPVFEDLAHFLGRIRFNKLQDLTGGAAFSLAVFNGLESAFLASYFYSDSEPIPWRNIRQYEIRDLLIQWSTGLWRREAFRFGLLASSLARSRERQIVRRLQQIGQELACDSRSLVRAHRRQAIETRLRQNPTLVSDQERLKPLDLRRGPESQHKFSTILRYQLTVAGRSRQLIVKLPRNERFEQCTVRGQAEAEIPDRPRLQMVLPPETEIEFEAEAMAKIQRYFQALHAPRLSYIPVIELISEQSALAMEHVTSPTLYERFAQESDPQRLITACRDAGRWLRAFHEIEINPATERRFEPKPCEHTLRDFLDYLNEHLEPAGRFDGLLARIARSWPQAVLAREPRVTVHGDFAAHNIFVNDRDEIFGFDTLAPYRGPRSLDLAYFQWTAGCHRRLARRGLVAQCNAALERGYFGDEPVPRASLDACTLLVGLDKWCSAVAGCQRASAWKRRVKSARLRCRNRRFQSWLTHILDRLSTETA